MKPKRQSPKSPTDVSRGGGTKSSAPKGVAGKGRNLSAETSDYLRRRALLNALERRKRLRAKLGSISASGGKPPGPKKNRPSKKQRQRSVRGHFRVSGGVMVPYVLVLPGRRVITSWSTSGGVTTVTTTPQALNQGQTIFDNILSSHGDFKHPTAHQFQKKLITYDHGFIQSGDGLNGSRTEGDQCMGLGLSASFGDGEALVMNKALSKAYDAIRSDVDLAVDIAEGHKTHQMMSTRFKQASSVLNTKLPVALRNLGGLVRTFRRSNPRDWGNLWLEFTYGWRPLAKSIYGALDNAISESKKANSTQGHKVRAKATEIIDNRGVIIPGGTGVQTWQTVYKKFGCKYEMFYAIPTSRLNSLANYTSLNPVSIAWELVPYSFVFDWFVDVGGYLRNLESGLLYSSDFVMGYVSTRYYSRVTETKTVNNASSSGESTGSNETKWFRRSVLSSSPLPRVPGFNARLSNPRLFSAASLLGQQLHSLKH